MNNETNQLLYQIVKAPTQHVKASNEMYRAPSFFQTKIQMNIFYYLLTNVKENEDGTIQTKLNMKEICKFYEGNVKNIKDYRDALEFIRTHSDVTMAIPDFRIKDSDIQSDSAGEEENKVEITKTGGDYSVYKGNLIIGYQYTRKNGKDGDDFVVDFNPKFRPALVNIDSRYSTLFLDGLKIVGSRNGARIYIFLISWLDNATNNPSEIKWYTNSDDPKMPGIRQVLNLMDKYPRENDFRRIVERAFNDVNEYSDIEIIESTLSSQKDFYRLRFCKKAHSFIRDRNRLMPEVKIEPEEVVCWRAVELINLLINKNYTYTSYTTRAQIKKRLNAGYPTKTVLGAVLKQYFHFSDAEALKTNMSPLRIFPTVKKNQSDYFDVICQYNEPNIFSVLDQYMTMINEHLDLYQYEALFYGIYLCINQFLSGWLADEAENADAIMEQAVSVIDEEYQGSLIEFIRSSIRRPIAKSSSRLDVDMQSIDYCILKKIVPAFGIDVMYKAVETAAACGNAQMLFIIGILYLLKRHGLVDGFRNSDNPSKFLYDHIDMVHNHSLDSLKGDLSRFIASTYYE